MSNTINTAKSDPFELSERDKAWVHETYVYETAQLIWVEAVTKGGWNTEIDLSNLAKDCFSAAEVFEKIAQERKEKLNV